MHRWQFLDLNARGTESCALVHRRRHRARLVAFAPACLWGTPNHAPPQTAASRRAMPLQHTARPANTTLARHTAAHARTHTTPARAIALRLAACAKLCRHTTLTLAAGAGLGVSAAAAPCAPTTQAAAAMASSSACASAWACLHHDHCILRGHAAANVRAAVRRFGGCGARL